MALLSNGSSSMQINSTNGTPNQTNSNAENNEFNPNDHLFFSSLFNALPRWDVKTTGPVAVPQNLSNAGNRADGSHDDDLMYSNVLGAIGTNTHSQSQYHLHNNHNEMLGAIGTAAISLTPSSSPQTSSSAGSSHCVLSSAAMGASCGTCDIPSISRCLDCNDVLCEDCVHIHRNTAFTKDHQITGLNTLSPIGVLSSNIQNIQNMQNIQTIQNIQNIQQSIQQSIQNIQNPQSVQNGNNNNNLLNNATIDPQCETHGEILRYLCETCKKIVCQECTLWEHKEHSCIPVAKVSDGAQVKLQAVIDSGKLGTKYIKASIDRAVSYSQAVERDAMEATARVRKALRHFIMAAEDRERTLIERVDKIRQQKLTSLSDQMAGLRSALSGLAQTSDNLIKAFDNISNMSNMEIATSLTRGESQMEQFAAMYKNLQPKEEFITFVPPNFELLQEIRLQGDIVMTSQRMPNTANVIPSTSSCVLPTLTNGGNGNAISSSGNILTRRPIVRSSTTPPASGSSRSAWDPVHSNGKNGLSTSPNTIGNIGPIPGVPNIGQCVPGSNIHVVAKPALGPSTTFGFDGHEDGQVSRPWGLCVDKDGHILVADRRNNRVQIFYADGSFKLKFGTKGTGNGQFDLPAGICTDPQNRIIIVDKDNHRVQVFTHTGTFILKFGSYGKDCGQFQYPWDVVVNSKGEMLVTDSRNHRIQLFNPEGHFISRFSFDGLNHSRYLKGLTTPRGACFTPQGDIIISDFENHRLLLIDSNLTKILAAKGHEGSNLHEFSRPSGICCDDDGRVIVADSKNQRVLIFSPQLEFLWTVEIRPSANNLLTVGMDEKDRPSDVALMPDGRLVVMVETSPDARDQCSPQKTFVQIY